MLSVVVSGLTLSSGERASKFGRKVPKNETKVP